MSQLFILNRLDLYFVLLALFCFVLSVSADENTIALDSSHRVVLDKYCYGCHNEKKTKGKVRLDDLSFEMKDLATAERWQAVLDVINAGDMPPEDEEQFPKATKTNLLDDLSNVMVATRRSFLDKGGDITVRRLNAREYQNTLRDLLGVEITVAELPSDFQADAFDTVGVNLFMSAHQIKTYRELGRKALDESLLWFKNHKLQQSLRFEPEDKRKLMDETIAFREKYARNAEKWIAAAKQAFARPENKEIVQKLLKKAKNHTGLLHHWKEIPGTPSPAEFDVLTGGFGPVNNAINDAKWNTNGGYGSKRPYLNYLLNLPHQDEGLWLAIGAMWKDGRGWGVFGNHYCLYLPMEWDDTFPGDYVLKIRLGHAKDAPPERRFVEVGINTRSSIVLGTYKVTGTVESPDVLEIPLKLSRENILPYQKHLGDYGNARNHEIYIKERVEKDTRAYFGKAKKENGIGPKAAIWVDWMQIERVSSENKALPVGIEAIQDVLAEKDYSEVELSKAIKRFSEVAFRGILVKDFNLDGLLNIYKLRRNAKASHLEALKHVLSIVLSLPSFIYKTEPKSSEKGRRPLSANELAIRLSYFLWGAPPDRKLNALASSGKLLDPEVLRSETNRLMNHENFRDFIIPFTDQWLGMDRFELFEVDRKKHPGFDPAVKEASRQELYETVSYLFTQNRSLHELLKADYVVIDPVLAHHYQLEGTNKNGFHKVSLPAKSPRGGFLGMAGVHYMGSDGSLASPVERGAWILRKVLNDPPPPAPANVPQLARLSNKLLTKKERVTMHQSDSQCASCHRKIDPLGFGLENFNAVGIWREEDSYEVKDPKDKNKSQKKSWKIDASGQFHKGPSFKDYFEMRDLIYDKNKDFSYGFFEALLEYSLGRNVGFSDEPLILDLMETVEKQDFKARAFVHAIVQNKVFKVK